MQQQQQQFGNQQQFQPQQSQLSNQQQNNQFQVFTSSNMKINNKVFVWQNQQQQFDFNAQNQNQNQFQVRFLGWKTFISCKAIGANCHTCHMKNAAIFQNTILQPQQQQPNNFNAQSQNQFQVCILTCHEGDFVCSLHVFPRRNKDHPDSLRNQSNS